MGPKVKKKTICCGLDISMFDSLERMSQETGAKKLEMIRRAIKKIENGGVDDWSAYIRHKNLRSSV